MAGTQTGGCQCGAVRYEIDASRATGLVCCHCRECQRQSASAFGMSMMLPRAAFRLLRGELATWQRRSARGSAVRAHFCPGCGVRIFHDDPDGAAITLKAGTLDDTSALRPVAHLWTDRAQPWLALPAGTLTYAGEPDDGDAAIEAAWRQRGGC